MGKKKLKGVVYIKNITGHRQSYLDLLSRELILSSESGKLGLLKFWRLVSVKRLLLATIDDSYLDFIVIVVLRALIRRKTVALFLRPSQCFKKDRVAFRVKRWVFILIKYLPGLSVLTIIPFELKPELKKVANNWVHDPQLWDIAGNNTEPISSTLADKIGVLAGNRKVLCFIGGASKIKGFQYLAQIFKESPLLSEKIYVVAVGKVEKDCKRSAAVLKNLGMCIIDRFATDIEIMDLYIKSDLVWCCYHPDYDQPSGIYGRALQLGRCPIIRSGALLEKYSAFAGINTLSLPFAEPQNAADILGNAENLLIDSSHQLLQKNNEWRSDFIKKVEEAL